MMHCKKGGDERVDRWMEGGRVTAGRGRERKGKEEDRGKGRTAEGAREYLYSSNRRHGEQSI